MEAFYHRDRFLIYVDFPLRRMVICILHSLFRWIASILFYLKLLYFQNTFGVENG